MTRKEFIRRLLRLRCYLCDEETERPVKVQGKNVCAECVKGLAKEE